LLKYYQKTESLIEGKYCGCIGIITITNVIQVIPMLIRAQATLLGSVTITTKNSTDSATTFSYEFTWIRRTCDYMYI